VVRTSCLFPSDRQLSVDLVKARKKKDSKKKKKGEEKEFRSIFDHIQHDTAKLREKSPVETFAQHIVSLVHHVKERKFKPSDVTLSERFARAQEEAGEETRKKKKSPEIHRRIDISPRTIKPRTHTDAHSRESSPGGQAEEEMNRNPEDLRYDLERRRKERSDEPEYWREGSEEHHNYRCVRRVRKQTQYKRDRGAPHVLEYPPRERSRSYSPGNELHDHHDPHEPHEPHQPPYGPGGFDKSRLGNKPYFFNRGNFRARPPFHYRGQFRGQYRGRGNYYNNNYNNSNTFPQRRPPEEEWDPEYTPKSKKYFLHDDRDEREEDGHWGRRPRARGFFPRGARGRPWHRPGDSPVWTHDKYEVSDDEDDNNDNEGAGGTSDAPSDAAATTT
uniref:Btz domain-containing protein n=1 Tax=Petromyzon marinus TaxID=7757 RepID=S4RYE7_PETMA